jgi:outer membrane receptor protein involved in Fe transport
MYTAMAKSFQIITLTFVLMCPVVLCSGPVLLAGQQDANEPEDLFDMSIEELLNIEVSVASKKPEPTTEAPGVVVVVTRNEIELYGDRNLHQLMQRQPSVYTRSSFVYSDNLAAFRGDMSTHAEMHTLILLNGRPIRESAQGHNVNMYTTFPLTSLESVELIRGPGSVLYGTNAFTGVINLKSRAVPENREFSVSSLAGSHEYYDATVSYGERFGDLGIVADIRTAGQHGFSYSLFDQAGIYGEDNEYNRSVSGTAHLEYGNFTFDFFGSDLNAFSLGVFPFWSNTNNKICNKKLFANLGYRYPIQDRTTLEFNVTYNLQENQLSSPRPMMIGTNTSDLLGEVTVYTNPTDKLNVVGGFLQEYRSNYKADKNDFQSIPSYDYDPMSAYVQGDYKLGDCVKAIAGTQWNESPLGDSDFVNRYGVIITPEERWGLKLLRGEAFRGPVALESDLYDPAPPPGLVGNKNLKPETITTYDAQLFYHDSKTYAAITYFDSTINDLIIYDTSVLPFTYMNGGEQKFNGVEFETKHSVTPQWHVLASYMYQNNKADVGLNPSVVPDNMAKFGTAYTWNWGTASIFYSYFGTPPTIASPIVVNPEPEAANLLSANVRIDISEWLGPKKGQSTLTLRAENILNEKIHVPTMAYTGSPNSFPYGPGATFYAGLAIHF